MPSRLSALELIKNFDELPDDAVVSLEVSRIIRGGISEWTDRRNPDPRLPRIPISLNRFGHRVGNIRAVVRGNHRPDSMNPA
jgi:hypothetical protein